MDYYRRLKKSMHKADRILIMGPGETKHGLMKVIKADPPMAAKVAGVETCDKMTLNQIVSRVKFFFHLHSNGLPVRGWINVM